MKYNTFSDVQKNLDRLGMFHMELSLSRMEAFARAWNRELSSVHVVGTNGKGSTSTFFESIAREHGLMTGLYTSPHFLSPRERVLVQGQMINEEFWVQHANELEELCPDIGLTYFEWLTCLAALAFDNAGVDVAVMEAGLGGRYDATRVFLPALVLLTPVGLDHEAYLGDTFAKVAKDKCRAISAGCVAITTPQQPEVMAVYERQAKAVGATLQVAEAVSGMELGLAGEHQAANAGLAMAGWKAWCSMHGLRMDDEACARGLQQAWMPGRFQIVPAKEKTPRFILDGAHNAHGLLALSKSLVAAGIRPDVVIFGCMKDKDMAGMREAVGRLACNLIIAAGIPGNDRAMKPEELASVLGSDAQAVNDMRSSLAMAFNSGAKTVMVCGSLYLIAEFYKLHPDLINCPEKE